MTGTGTQAAPYVVSAWDEFVEAMSEAGVYISIVEGTEWDFNDIAPEGASFYFAGAGNVIIGNNATFKNIFFDEGKLFDYSIRPVFNGVNFTNIYAAGTGVFAAGAGFYNCGFSGKFYENSAFVGNSYVLDSTVYFGVANGQGCAFNLGFYNNASFSHDIYGANFSSPNIILSGLSSGSCSTIKIYDGLIQGIVPFSTMNFKADRSIFDITVTGTISNSGSYSVINTDKVSGTQSGFLEATSNTIRSTAYLDSIGFPIGDDS